MKKDIKLLTRQCCNELVASLQNKERRAIYLKDTFDPSLLEFLDFETGYKIDSELSLDPEISKDAENSIIIHKALDNLDPVQANDKRLWVSLTHTHFYNYVSNRFSGKSIRFLKERFHFEGSSINTRMSNGVSRLWWAAHLTIDEEREDKYELTKAVFEMQDLYVALFERKIGTYPNLVKAFIEFYIENRNLGSVDLQLISKGLNSIGGIKLLPSLTIDEIKKHIREIANHLEIEVEKTFA